jgi:hypothetical protein
MVNTINANLLVLWLRDTAFFMLGNLSEHSERVGAFVKSSDLYEHKKFRKAIFAPIFCPLLQPPQDVLSDFI